MHYRVAIWIATWVHFKSTYGKFCDTSLWSVHFTSGHILGIILVKQVRYLSKEQILMLPIRYKYNIQVQKTTLITKSIFLNFQRSNIRSNISWYYDLFDNDISRARSSHRFTSSFLSDGNRLLCFCVLYVYIFCSCSGKYYINIEIE